MLQGATLGTEITGSVVEGDVNGIGDSAAGTGILLKSGKGRKPPRLWIDGDVVGGTVVVRDGIALGRLCSIREEIGLGERKGCMCLPL